MAVLTKAASKKTLGEKDPAKVRYWNLVEETAEALRDNNKRNLSFYHDLGAKVNELRASGDSKYGNATVEKFAKDLKVESGIPLGLSSLYKSARFQQAVTSAQLKKMIQVGWSWRNVAFICSEQVPDNVRQNTIKRVEAGEIEQSKVKEHVRDEVPALKRNRRSSRSPIILADQLTSTNRAYRERLDYIPGLVKKLQEYKPNARAPFKEKIDSVRSELAETIKAATAHMKALDSLSF